jgi:hypothetical protein
LFHKPETPENGAGFAGKMFRRPDARSGEIATPDATMEKVSRIHESIARDAATPMILDPKEA